MTATIGGKERELTVEEVLQQQTLKEALAGKRMAVRKLLKMIETREVALARKYETRPAPVIVELHHHADNANEALHILGIAEPEPEPEMPTRWKLHNWATQAAISRPGNRKFAEKDVKNIEFFTFDAHTLRWPRGRTG